MTEKSRWKCIRSHPILTDIKYFNFLKRQPDNNKIPYLYSKIYNDNNLIFGKKHSVLYLKMIYI